MKRKAIAHDMGYSEGDVRKDFTVEQLASIGAVIIAWNDLEQTVDSAVCLCLEARGPLWLDISTRLSGFDAKCDLIKAIAKGHFKLPDTLFAALENTLAAIKEQKGYRDTIAHARVHDTRTGIGESVQHRAIYHVLLTTEALNALYRRMVALRLEMGPTLAILDLMPFLSDAPPKRAAAPDRRWIEESIQAHTDLLAQIQKKRRSLPPLPALPKAPAAPSKKAATKSSQV